MNSFLKDIKGSVITDHANIVKIKKGIDLFALNVSLALHQQQDAIASVVKSHNRAVKLAEAQVSDLTKFVTRFGFAQFRQIQYFNYLL